MLGRIDKKISNFTAQCGRWMNTLTTHTRPNELKELITIKLNLEKKSRRSCKPSASSCSESMRPGQEKSLIKCNDYPWRFKPVWSRFRYPHLIFHAVGNDRPHAITIYVVCAHGCAITRGKKCFQLIYIYSHLCVSARAHVFTCIYMCDDITLLPHNLQKNRRLCMKISTNTLQML